MCVCVLAACGLETDFTCLMMMEEKRPIFVSPLPSADLLFLSCTHDSIAFRPLVGVASKSTD